MIFLGNDADTDSGLKERNRLLANSQSTVVHMVDCSANKAMDLVSKKHKLTLSIA